MSFITYTLSGNNEQPVFTVQPTCSSLHLVLLEILVEAGNNNRKTVREYDYELYELQVRLMKKLKQQQKYPQYSKHMFMVFVIYQASRYSNILAVSIFNGLKR